MRFLKIREANQAVCYKALLQNGWGIGVKGTPNVIRRGSRFHVQCDLPKHLVGSAGGRDWLSGETRGRTQVNGGAGAWFNLAPAVRIYRNHLPRVRPLRYRTGALKPASIPGDVP